MRRQPPRRLLLAPTRCRASGRAAAAGSSRLFEAAACPSRTRAPLRQQPVRCTGATKTRATETRHADSDPVTAARTDHVLLLTQKSSPHCLALRSPALSRGMSVAGTEAQKNPSPTPCAQDRSGLHPRPTTARAPCSSSQCLQKTKELRVCDFRATHRTKIHFSRSVTKS